MFIARLPVSGYWGGFQFTANTEKGVTVGLHHWLCIHEYFWRIHSYKRRSSRVAFFLSNIFFFYNGNMLNIEKLEEKKHKVEITYNSS